jgi:hypothetical protein
MWNTTNDLISQLRNKSELSGEKHELWQIQKNVKRTGYKASTPGINLDIEAGIWEE